MVDWTPVLTAAITALSSLGAGVIGHSVARLQTVTEMEKLRDTDRQALRTQRREAYVGLLDVERRACTYLLVPPPGTSDEVV
jgi:hypothetical protein